MVKAFAAVMLLFSSVVFADSKTYTVKGMSCEACTKNIEAKVCALPGIDNCKVEMGQVTLISKNPIDDALISKTVKAAGHYSVTSSKAAATAAPPPKEAPANK